MSDAKQRLSRLIDLATHDVPENRRQLALDLCDLLLDWPSHYPQNMREPFEALLEKTVRVIDSDTRQALAEKLGSRTEAPMELLNEFFFDAPAETRDAILLRNALMDREESAADFPNGGVGEASLIESARRKPQSEFADSFAILLGIERMTAEQILHDPTARGLAVACKGAHFRRATFSALALLTEATTAPNETYRRLSTFDIVPLTGAERMLGFWRDRCEGQHRAA